MHDSEISSPRGSAPAFPLAPACPTLAYARDTGTPVSPRPARATPGQDHSGAWLRNAAAGLCVLAAAAAAVSFTAQYRLVYAARHLPAIAALEAAIPDAAALVFACLGIALALHGRRAIRARALNVASVAASVFMNVIAAAPGWRNLAVWAMPPVAYALASDTLIGVVRAWAIARHQHLAATLAADEATPLAIPGGLLLWLLRLALAPASTLAGFRAWVLEECPVAPGRRRPAGCPAGPSGSAAPAAGDQDRPVPGPSHRTARPARRDPAGPRRHDLRRPGAPGRPEHRRRPDRAAQRRARRPERRPPMIIKYAIALAVVLVVAGVRRVGVPARPVPARQPGPPPADPAAPAAAPRQGLRHRLQPVAALGPPGRAAPLRPDPPLPPVWLPPP